MAKAPEQGEKPKFQNYPLVRQNVFTFKRGDCCVLHGSKFVGDCEIVDTLYEPPHDPEKLGQQWNGNAPFPQVIVTMDEDGNKYKAGQRVILNGDDLQSGMLMFVCCDKGRPMMRWTPDERRTLRMRNLTIQAIVNSHLDRNSTIFFDTTSDWAVFNSICARVMVFKQPTNMFVFGNGIYRIVGSGHTEMDEFHVEYMGVYDATVAQEVGYTMPPKNAKAQGLTRELLDHLGVEQILAAPVG